MLSGLVNKISTTNYGGLAYIFDGETQYSGNYGNINISGHVLLNQCGTLLTRSKYRKRATWKTRHGYEQ